jgi:hypothetical protein
VSSELPRADEINRHVRALDVRYHGMTDDRSRFERGSMTHGGYIAGRLYHEVIERLQPTRPLSWLREHYERVEWDLLGTVPPVSRSTPPARCRPPAWLDGSGPALAREALLLEEIALRTAAVRTAAPHRADIVPALAEAFPALRAGTHEVTLPASLMER